MANNCKQCSKRIISHTTTPLPKAYDCVAVYIAGRRTSLVVYGWWPQPPTKKKKKPFTLTFRICINTPSGSSSRECCIPAQDCFKGPRLAAVAEPQAPQVGTIEQSKVEKAISIRGSATLWATTEAPAEPGQTGMSVFTSSLFVGTSLAIFF